MRNDEKEFLGPATALLSEMGRLYAKCRASKDCDIPNTDLEEPWKFTVLE